MINYTTTQKEKNRAAWELRMLWPSAGMLAKLDTLLYSKHLSAIERVAYLHRIAELNGFTKPNIMGIIRELDTLVRVRSDREKNNKSQ